MDRAFELLLKSIIINRGGKIRERGKKETIGFEKCVRKCLSEEPLKCISEDQALTIQVINSLRDAAQHHLLDISEQQLYIYIQAGVTIINDLLIAEYDANLSEFMPERVLPVSTEHPTDIISLFEHEFNDIREMVQPGSRKQIQARAKLRSMAIVESSLQGERTQPSPNDLKRIVQDIQDGKDCRDIFPGVSSLHISERDDGIPFSLRITKREGESVHIVPEGTPGATIVAVKRVNELGFYNLGLNQVSDKIGLTPPKTLAVIKHLRIQANEEFFKIIKIGSAEYKRYSQKVLNPLLEAIPELDLERVWEENRPRRR